MHWKTQFAIAYREKGYNELIVTGEKNWRSRNCKWRQSSANPSDICFRQPIFERTGKKLDHVLLITYFINNKKHQAIFIFYGAFLLYRANRKLNDLSMICFVFPTKPHIWPYATQFDYCDSVDVYTRLYYNTKALGTNCFHVVAVALVNVWANFTNLGSEFWFI